MCVSFIHTGILGQEPGGLLSRTSFDPDGMSTDPDHTLIGAQLYGWGREGGCSRVSLDLLDVTARKG